MYSEFFVPEKLSRKSIHLLHVGFRMNSVSMKPGFLSSKLGNVQFFFTLHPENGFGPHANLLMMKKTILFLVIALIQFARVDLVNAQVVINEYSCSNLSQYVDNHSDYEDWIELYNTTASPVDLAGWYLSDDTLNPTQWQMPAGITIAANGFLRFWASGRNEVTGTSYHTNFKLKQCKNTNEWVVLSSPSGSIVDAHEVATRTQLGHSIGRVHDGGASWAIFKNPTFNLSNNTAYPYLNYAYKPDFSVPAGFYPSAQTVTITTTEPSSQIRYTLDGTLPTSTSALYTTPITISSTTVLKAITFSSNVDILPSFIRYQTYFINVSHTLPVVSVSATQLTTLANGSGSIVPFGSFEYFNVNKQLTAHTYGEFNRHGQDSWANSQRSLDFVSRDEMGYNDAVKEVLFNTSPRSSYQRVILRAAGDDNYPADHHASNAGSAHVRDAYVHNLALHGGLDVDVRRGSKCIVYLNGAYWGVYDLRDNPDDHDNTDYYYGQDKFHLYYIETWGSTWAQYGGAAALADWSALRSFIMANDLSVPSNYQHVSDRLDVKSLTDYVLANMFSVCSDWLNWNTAWWRGTDSTGTHLKWGYILWDNDATFGHYINYTHIPDTSASALPCYPESIDGSNDPEDHIGVLLRLRQNPAFNQYYITRQFDLWNTVFSCNNMIPELDSTANLIDPEMTQHAARWAGTYSEWQHNVLQLRNYIIRRCDSLVHGWQTCYSVTGPHSVTINADPVGAGTVNFNSLTLTTLPWTGNYFGGINNNLEAVANPDFEFVNWSANSQTFTPNDSSVTSTVNLTNSDTIIAHFNTTIVGVPELIPIKTPIVSAYPTVTSGEVIIQFTLPEISRISLKLFSMLGNEISEINTNGNSYSQGNHVASVNLSKSNLPAGMYLLEFVSENFKQSIKIIYSPNY